MLCSTHVPHPEADYPEVFCESARIAAEPQTRMARSRLHSVEDIVYIGLGLLLAGSSAVLLVTGMISFGQGLVAGSLVTNIVALLDRILLILLFVELLYTVQVSFREHALVPEPFLLVGLIAAIRRVLVLTAEFSEVHDKPEADFQRLIVELAVLTFLIVALVVSLFLLQKRGGKAVAERVK
jgi:phosphate starvation-inducible membrane PsiE